MKAGELIRRYTAGERDFSGVDLSGAILFMANLRGADLSGAILSRANLCGADLREANLRGADLRGADLRGASLRGADLRQANLRRVEPMSDVNLSRTTLADEQLIMAILEGATLPDGIMHD